jgi:hypothetical protein
MLGQWGFFDHREPRMDPYRWIALIFRLFKPMRIFHFQLGEAAGQERLYAAQHRLQRTAAPSLRVCAQSEAAR